MRRVRVFLQQRWSTALERLRRLVSFLVRIPRLVSFVVRIPRLPYEFYEHKVKPFFWRHADTWWGMAIPLFVQGVILLAAWLSISLLIMVLLAKILPYVFPRLSSSLPEQIGPSALIPALIGFAIQQWKMVDDERIKARREKEKQQEERIQIIVSLCQQGEFDSAARAYITLCEDEFLTPRTRYILEDGWQKSAPQELQHTVQIIQSLHNEQALKRAVETAGGREQAVRALQWAYERMGERFRPQVVESLARLGEGKSVREHFWPFFIRAYKMSVEASSERPTSENVWKGVFARGGTQNPFSSEMAEDDFLSMITGSPDFYIDPPWRDEIRRRPSGIFLRACLKILLSKTPKE